MKRETLERLLNEACELLIIFEDNNVMSDDDKNRIDAIFNEIKYADEIDNDKVKLLEINQNNKQREWTEIQIVK